jgi:hypothetical protein
MQESPALLHNYTHRRNQYPVAFYQRNHSKTEKLYPSLLSSLSMNYSVIKKYGENLGPLKDSAFNSPIPAIFWKWNERQGWKEADVPAGMYKATVEGVQLIDGESRIVYGYDLLLKSISEPIIRSGEFILVEGYNGV